jgi:hypothetical protein
VNRPRLLSGVILHLSSSVLTGLVVEAEVIEQGDFKDQSTPIVRISVLGFARNRSRCGIDLDPQPTGDPRRGWLALVLRATW